MSDALGLQRPHTALDTPAPRVRLQVSQPLLIALALALVYHGGLLLSGSYQRTYDAYVHIFFADHYVRSWFDPWDTRWYTGFTLTSYPPGSQYSIALLSSVLGLRNAFVVVQLCAVLWVVVGTYRYAKIWVSEEAAGYAAILAVFSSSITETIHVFGQLPTTFSLGFLLNALPYVYRWLRRGELRILLVAWSVNAATTAGHHVSTLFGAVFFVAPVIALALAESLREPLPDEEDIRPPKITRANLWPLIIRRVRRLIPSLVRTGVYGVGLVTALVVVVLPYWLWSKADPITQVSIPHASRDSFLANPNAGLVFWLIPYGLTVLIFPYIYAKGFTTRAWPLAGSIAVLMLLGTGGTTPIPKKLLGGAFDVLTLDRFTFWATINMLPLTGAFVVSMRKGRLARAFREQLGTRPWYAWQIGLAVLYLVLSAFIANLTYYRKFQPAAIDVQPIVTFIEKDQHTRWRFMTLGFGDQVAWLSAQTMATSVDGNYHSARRLPELTSTPVERLEGSKYSGMPGIGSLQQFMAVPDKYNLKYIFSNDQFYDPLLFFSGWHRLQRLENGIVVWEHADIPPLPEVLPRKEIPVWQGVMWGTVPIGALFLSLIMIAGSTLRDLRLGVGTTTIGDAPAAPLYTGSHPLARLWARIDGWLRARAALPADDSGPVVVWQPWLDWFRRLRQVRVAPAAFHIRVLRSVLILAVLLSGGVVAGGNYLQRYTGPQGTIERYYDDLDFRRFSAAYETLDPQSRPSYDQYLLELSVQGGLVASYGKLNSMYTSIEMLGSDRAIARVRLVLVTSLDYYDQNEVHEMVRRDGRWYILPKPGDPTTPPDTFFRQGTVAWYAAGRRRVSTGPTEFGDLLDRPQIATHSSRLVRVDGQYHVVGEVTNIDSNPSDTTVKAILYDPTGQELSRYNAQGAMIHKLLPQEMTPFRVDFEGVAGAVLTDTARVTTFRPKDFTPLNVLSPVGAHDLQAYGVVTTHDLVRPLAVQDVRVEQDASGAWRVTGRLYNVGSQEATIPHVLVSLYDADGAVLWVQDVYVESAVRPQRSQPFSVALRPAGEVESVQLLDSRTPEERAAALGAPDVLPLPPETGYAAVRVTVSAYLAGSE